jgi:hypothetical protein
MRARCAEGKKSLECAHSRQKTEMVMRKRKVTIGKLRADDERREEDIPLKME